MALPENLSEAHIREHCPHCDPTADAFRNLLEETDQFRIVCDVHPIIEGHSLIIPKAHLSCVGEYDDSQFNEFAKHYEKVSAFVQKHYGSASTFEHGKIGQSVFHSHVHILPFEGEPTQIVPEGLDHCTPLSKIEDLRSLYRREGMYLFFSIGNRRWMVDTSLAAPRFFRDRFAAALGRPERGNWKEMHMDEQLMAAGQTENARTRSLWISHY